MPPTTRAQEKLPEPEPEKVQTTPFTWKASFTTYLLQHLRLLNSLVLHTQDHDLEGEQYHLLNVSLTFMAGRMLPVDADYVVSVHPQAPLRSPPRAHPIPGAEPDPVHLRPLTRGLRATIQEALDEERADEGMMLLAADDMLDQSLPADYDPLAETSLITHITEVDRAPREVVRSPDFISIISFLPEGDRVEAEERPLFVHEAKRYPPEFLEAIDNDAKLDAVTELTAKATKQAAEQAYKAFYEYPTEDLIQVMFHVGIYFRVIQFERESTQRLVPQLQEANIKEQARWMEVATRPYAVECMYNIVFSDDGSMDVREYSTIFKTFLTKARTRQVKRYMKGKGV